VTPGEVQGIYNRARTIIEACGLERVSDLQRAAAAVEQYLKDRRDARNGISGQTSNHYLQSIKQFSRWLRRQRRIADDPLAHLSRLNVRTDRRHDRRALEAEEFARLVEAAESGGRVEGMTGPDRAMLYVLAAWTGYRRKELASLTRRSIDLAADPPTVRVAAAYSKNGREDETPLHPVVTERLAEWLATKPRAPAHPLFRLQTPKGHWRKTSKMMRRDLEAAREKWLQEAPTPADRAARARSDFLTYRDEDGLYADFHANRHTFITNLDRAGVPLTMAQRLARHSTADLTAGTYTHVASTDKAAAIGRLPALRASEQDTAALRGGTPGKALENNTRQAAELQATGTDDLPFLAQRLRNSPPEGAFWGTAGDGKSGREEPAKGGKESTQPITLSLLGTGGHGGPGAPEGVETSGLEPPTPGLQSRCSPS